jgi:hypothetical protein
MDLPEVSEPREKHSKWPQRFKQAGKDEFEDYSGSAR